MKLEGVTKTLKRIQLNKCKKEADIIQKKVCNYQVKTSIKMYFSYKQVVVLVTMDRNVPLSVLQTAKGEDVTSILVNV